MYSEKEQVQNRKMQIKSTFVGAVSQISIVGKNKQAGKQADKMKAYYIQET